MLHVCACVCVCTCTYVHECVYVCVCVCILVSYQLAIGYEYKSVWIMGEGEGTLSPPNHNSAPRELTEFPQQPQLKTTRAGIQLLPGGVPTSRAM